MDRNALVTRSRAAIDAAKQRLPNCQEADRLVMAELIECLSASIEEPPRQTFSLPHQNPRPIQVPSAALSRRRD